MQTCLCLAFMVQWVRVEVKWVEVYWWREKEKTYLCWWYKLKSMSDSACKKNRNTRFHLKLDVNRQCIITFRGQSTSQSKRGNEIVALTCKSLPSSKCKTSRIVSDWMNAAKTTTGRTHECDHRHRKGQQSHSFGHLKRVEYVQSLAGPNDSLCIVLQKCANQLALSCPSLKLLC